MEFHENISMEFYGVPQKLNSMEFCLVLGHVNSSCLNTKDFSGNAETANCVMVPIVTAIKC